MQLLRDPLLHFTLMGAALFAGFVLLSGDDGRDDLIVVSAAQQEQLAAAFTRTWRTPPGPAEMDNLVDDWVREEIANREARAMGLAEGDLIVRRRLRQKFEAFMDQLALRNGPTDAELQAWYGAHRDNYRTDARFSLTQRFFSSDRRADARADATRALASLDATADAAAHRIGDALALPQQFSQTRASELRERFGAAFVQGLRDLPEGRWAGPVPSAYGYHLVYLEQALDARVPPLEEVRDDVLRDWRDAQLRAAREQLYGDLRDRYRVRVEPARER